jgi:DNA-binding NarL/FixJ family response regulator
LDAVQEALPDLLVTGLHASDRDVPDVELIGRARALAPGLKVVVFTADGDPDRVEASLRAGADAYVLETADAQDLLCALRQVFSQSIFLPAAGSVARLAPVVRVVPAHGLTRRELEILRLVAEGHSNAQLARMLWVTEQTVKFHLSNIYRKLAVGNRTEAARWAQVNGVLDRTSLRVVA